MFYSTGYVFKCPNLSNLSVVEPWTRATLAVKAFNQNLKQSSNNNKNLLRVANNNKIRNVRTYVIANIKVHA